MARMAWVAAAAAFVAATAWPASYYPVKLEDAKAVYVTRDEFGVRGDGAADDTEGLQKAIDKVQESSGQGVVFLPEGRYRITKTIYVWPGIRVIGYGADRPVLVLGARTPGFEDPGKENYMVFFAGMRPGGRGGPGGVMGASASGRPPQPQGPRISALHGLNVSQPYDATPGTFYSAMSNVDIEIGEGNPGAAGVRARYAQHCYLAHMEFRTGSGFAGLRDGGNYVEDVRFVGGKWGVMTRKPSPGWQLTLVDARFEGQREGAIKTHEAGLTLIHPHFQNVPTAVSIDPDYAEELWIKNGRMENISGPAILISREQSPKTEINVENVLCRNVKVFASFRESGRTVPGAGDSYEVKTFSHGLHFADMGAAGAIRTSIDTAAVAAWPANSPDLPELPARDTWTNVRTFGAKGDGVSDDTEALRKAVASAGALYFPMGKYRVTGTIALKPETVLVGLHPSMTAIVLTDGTEAFQGAGGPVPVVESPKAGHNIMAGLGVYTNGINPRAVAVRWMAGADSMINDVRFLGGHGTSKIDGSREDIYNNTHTADPNLNRRWDGQYPSLWVTDGGGGTFTDIWTPSTFAQAGLYVSNTSTPGRVYHMSSEHHVRYELLLRNVSNWSIYSPQTEEERGEGGFASALEIENSSNITVANFHIYRVVSSFQPFPYAIRVSNSRNIRFRNVHCYTDAKASFGDTVWDATHDVPLRQREFAWINISGSAPARAASRVEKLAGGFYNIAGGAVDQNGDYTFVDAHWQRIYRWNAASRRLSIVSDFPLEPVNVAFDKAGNLLVASYGGKGVIYALKPGGREDDIQVLEPKPAAPRPGLTPVLPVNYYRLENDFVLTVPERRPYQYVSPDGSTFIPAGEDFVTGRMYYGSKLHDILRTFGLASAPSGKLFYVSNESEQQTYSARVDEYGTLTDLKPFVDRAAEGIAIDRAGNVYLADGHIEVYSPAGKLLETIEVPERPLHIAFGGPDGKTLFIAARSALYAVKVR